MKKQLFYFTLLLTFSLSGGLYAQDWVEKMKNPDVNFYDVQKAFNKYYVKKDRQIERQKRRMSKRQGEGVHQEEIEVPGFAQYKRWENFMAPRVFPTGERFDPSLTWRENEKYRKQFSTQTAGSWTLIGPTSTIPIGGGAGRLNFVRFEPGNANTIYVGSPAGGLWKSTDAGLTWSTNTDQLAQVIGCTDIAIDPTNVNTMYLATGDGDAGDTYTIGILKSTDGGQTWNTTGLSYYMANTRQISRILIDPTNTSTLLVASSAGIFRSTDAGATFTLVQTGGFKDMEFKPGDPSTMYACGTEFYRSTNNGQNWNKITTGFAAAANLSRMAIAVTDNDPTYVYVLAAKAATDYGFEGIYKSTNSGSSFSKVNTASPANVLGWNSNGADAGGQGWYDLAIAASPGNKDEIIVGGVNNWRSTNGGGNFSLIGHWTGSGAPYVHADVHDLVYLNSTTFYSANDGGLFSSSNGGQSWTDHSNGLQIGQMYGFGQSTTNANLLIQGWQDNGTNRYNGTWQEVMGGDGMLAFIDWNNDQNMWGSQYEGSLNRSTNGGNSWSSAVGNINEAGAWVTPWSQDPVNAGTIYAGFVNLWKSTNGGISWTKISAFTNNTTMTSFTVSPADNLVIWVSKPGGFYRSTNGGTSWTTITNVPPGTITAIACSNTDPNKAWITYSGFNNNNKVFQTTDQGVTWTNLSASIPNIPINHIVYQNNSNDALYIGTDVGAFYKDATSAIWQPFSNGLPNVIVSQLAIHYATNTIRASTYGRGMWESGLYVPGSYPPASAFGSSLNISCPGSAVQFSDYSAGQPTSWNWSFPGGSPSTSTQQNPLVFYNSAGTYPVTLITNNAIGGDTTTYNNFIIIASSSQADPATTGDVRCGPGTVNLSATGSGTGTLRWWDAPGGGNLLTTGNNYSPTITTTTTFYVDEELPMGQTDYVGESGTSTGTGAFFTANDIRGLYFDVTSPVIIQSFEVYSNSAGDRTIEIIDEQGNTYADTTIFIPASPTQPYTVNVNFTVYPGNNYFIKCRGLVDLYRMSSGAVYPYNSTAVNITGSNAGSPGYYYFFYFWTYTEIACNTGRTACVALDTCAVQGLDDLKAVNNFEIFPNPNQGEFTVKFNAAQPDNYTIKITNALGEVVHEYTLNAFIGEHRRTINLEKISKGVYMVNIISSDKSTVKRITIN
jgi:photosystem II stability/assembly factor-like uncharacterized protein